MERRRRAVIVAASVVVLIVAGSLGDYGDGGGGARNPLLPPDLAFGIWAPLYALAIAFAVHQVRTGGPVAAAVARPMALAYALAGLWVWIVPRVPLAIAEAVLVTTLAAGAVALRRLPVRRPGEGPGRRWAVRAAIGGFTGWITLAALITTVQLLLERGWLDAERDGAWLVAVAVVAGIAGSALAWRRAPAYAVAVAWGLGWLAIGALT